MHYRSRQVVLDVSARRLEAPARPGTRRAGSPAAQGSGTPYEAGGSADETGGAMDRGVPGVLGRIAGQTGGVFGEDQQTNSKERNIMSTKVAQTLTLEVKRLIKAPRERVFAAWTTPDAILKWLGSETCHALSAKVDLRVGGEYRIRSHSDQYGEKEV